MKGSPNITSQQSDQILDASSKFQVLNLVSYIDDILVNKAPLDMNSLSLINLALQTKLNTLKNQTDEDGADYELTNITSTKTASKNLLSNENLIALKDMKVQSSQLTEKSISLINLNQTGPIISSNMLYSSQIYNPTVNNETIDQTMEEKGLPKLDISDCVYLMAKYYNISHEDIVVTSEWVDAELSQYTVDNPQNTFQFKLYNSITNEKLDLSICYNTGITIKFPPQDISENELGFYKSMKEQGIDIFNPNDPGYTDRCTPVVDNSTGMDTTINYRRQNYLKFSIQCSGLNCTYQGIDDDNYTNCNCIGLDNDSTSFIEKKDTKLDPLKDSNFDIVFCSQAIFNVIILF
jgi:hypothetical protein